MIIAQRSRRGAALQGGYDDNPHPLRDRCDPVKFGLVASLARPGSNLTGINFLATELASKQLELLRRLVPTRPALPHSSIRPTRRLPNPHCREAKFSHVAPAANARRATGPAARSMRSSTILAREHRTSSSRSRFSPACSRLLAKRDAIRAAWSTQIVNLLRLAGYMTYGSDINDAYRQVGVYAGRILKGAKPADLPVVQSTKLELVINLQTARDSRPRNPVVAACYRR